MASRSRRGDNGQKPKSETPSASVTENESNDNDSEEEFDEPVKKKKSRRSNDSDMTLNKSILQMPEDMRRLIERILCCSCGKQINPMNPGALRKHPWLKVTTCRKCYKFLKSGPFTRDSDGIDEQCRWCGDGGRLYGCDYCNHCFCRSCIKRNLGRTEAARMEEDTGSKWHCYLCKPKKISKLVADCQKIIDFIEKEEQKEKERIERLKQREKEKEEKLRKEKKSDKLVVKTEIESIKEVKKEKEDDKSSSKPSRRSFPAPRDKDKIEVINVDSPKAVKVENIKKSDPDVVIIDGSPDKKVLEKVPHFQHHRATLYKPDSSTGVQKVVKEQNVLAVTVGPKKPAEVTTPYRDKAFVPIVVNSTSSGKLIGQPGLSQSGLGLLNPVQLQNANLHSLLSKPLLINGPGFNTKIVVQNSLRNKNRSAPNDIRQFKENVTAGNVESVAEKLSFFVQSLGLCIDGVKTDLSIAKLTQTNMFQARNRAVATVQSGFDTFFNSLRDMFYVQFVSNAAPGETSAQGASKNATASVTTASQKVDNSDAITIIEDDNGAMNKESSINNSSDKNLIVLSDTDSASIVGLNVEKNCDDVTIKDKMETDSGIDHENVDKVKTDSENKDKMETDTGKDREKIEKSKTEESTINCNETQKSNDDESMETDELDAGYVDETNKKQEEPDLEQKSHAENKEEVKNADNDLHDSENTAAELELLKEIADEIDENSDANEFEEEKLPTRRTTRKKGDAKIEENSDAEEMEEDQLPTRRTTRKKGDASVEDSTDSKKSRSLRKSSEENKSEKISIDRDNESCEADSSNTKRNSRRNKDSGKPEKENQTKDGKRVNKKDESVSNSETDVEKSVEENDQDDDGSVRRSSRNKNESKHEKKNSRSSLSSSDRSETNKSSKNDKLKSKKVLEDEQDSNNSDTSKDLDSKSVNRNSSKEGKGKRTAKYDDADDNENTENDKKTESKKSVKKGEPEKKSSKESKRPTDKIEKTKIQDSDSDTMDGPVDLPDIIANGEKSSEDESDSDESDDEGPKKKSKRKARESSQDLSSRKTRSRAAKNEADKNLRSKSKEKTPLESDSDPDFDVDLEKEISSLSKETRLTRKKKQEGKIEDESKKSEKSVKKKDQEVVSDSDTEEDVVIKAKDKKVEDDDEDDDDEEDEDELPPADQDDVEDDDDLDSDQSEQLTASQIKKLAKAKKAAEEDESDFDDEMPSDMSSDPEVSFPKLSTPKKGEKSQGKGKKSKFDDDISDDSDFVTPKKKKRFKSKILDAKISDSDSEEEVTGKKGAKKGKGKGKRKAEDTGDSDEDTETGKKKSKDKKRRRIKKIASSDEEREPGADDDIGTDEDVPDPDTPGGYLKRRKIRKVQGQKKLADETKAAQKAEEARRKRIEERQKEYNAYVEVEGAEEEGDIPEGTEREHVEETPSADSIAKILGSPKKVPVTTKCVLEMEENKKPLIEVDRTLIRKLKPHQVEAVRFMYNCCVESVARLKKEEGAGCILAHCMGLGKTLSVITFVHTLLNNVKHTKMTKCLVVCPLNTCLNWVNEFQIWLDDVDFEIEVYEMSRVKQNFERAQMLKEWHEGGAGVMILGYDMYRNLVQGSHCKNKKQKQIFYETLAEPGPDIVICDEGHILKNDHTTLSKAMNKITTRRRIVLTGTPLQNNLGEYHCMVSFVKPSLLGTRKEFYNRFANPITNGQCSDSTPSDVKVMKRRAHILHELLAGCVQRKDYSALTKFLPPKFEYVISVRLSKVQMSLYEKYLELSGVSGTVDTKTKGARLFKDYQALMRIWTHPWVLKLDEIRQENKRQFSDSEDSFIDSEDSEGEDSFIDDSTSDDDDDLSSDPGKEKKGRGKKNKKGSSSSSDEEGKSESNQDQDEIVKKWTSRRRGNEEGAGSSWMEDDMGYGGPKELSSEWWAEFVKEEDENKLELSGKLMLLFEILKMCEDIGDKVLVFSQSLLSLDIIEDFLAKIDAANQPESAGDGDKAENKDGKGDKPEVAAGSAGGSAAEKGGGEGSSEASGASKELSAEDKKAKELKERLSQYGKSWTKGADYFRMDGSTSSINRKAAQDMFNDSENFRARLFLISTKAGSLGINLVSANRVIIFDASWNPSHDIQSIFRVYRFGQVKPVYVYRFLAQGTMEEKIYERQVTKQSLSQRVVDEHQIERHFTAADLQELYLFTPDRLDDPNRKERPLPVLPKDHMLAEISTTNKEWIVTFHEHDSLLENVEEQKLTEDEKKAAWEDYENEKKGINMNMQKMMMGGAAMGGMILGQMGSAQQQMMATQQLNMQNLLLQGSANLGQAAVLQIVQDLKARFPTLSPDLFQQRVQAVLRQVLTQQIMQQSEMQRRQLEQHRLNELNRLNQIKQQIQRQQALLGSQQHSWNARGMLPTNSYGNLSQAASGLSHNLLPSGSMPHLQRHLMGNSSQQSANPNTQKK